MWNNALLQTWREGADVIPRVTYPDLVAGLSDERTPAIRKAGVAIVTGGVPQEEALSGKQSIEEYAATNSEHLTGYPSNNIQTMRCTIPKAKLLHANAPGKITTRVIALIKDLSFVLGKFGRPCLVLGQAKAPFTSDEWEVDLEGTEFPGSLLGGKQFLATATHPHLRLEKTTVAIPTVEPGDQVYWHCDVVNEVEAKNKGMGDSLVIHIPAVPLTITSPQSTVSPRSAQDIRSRTPPPDFPNGPGESMCVDRATTSDVSTDQGRRILGLEPFGCGSNLEFFKTINALLF
ncbi:Uncharacterized protein YbiU [Hypsizygus marmoreus]|uniref:Uncharacterized protein YbiU n=1 Tax=Hypsizygus marmoreus TaxID=39966 RepID=A0A369JBL3_HYPMA|nr:Uncharacterized protein YbiU [Hypsizygus marmoreus]